MNVEVSAVATPFRESIKERILANYGDAPPKLVGFLANSDPAARKYAEWTGRACLGDGIGYELREVDAMDLEKALHDANNDCSVHGIMIYYPVFGAEPSFDGGSRDDYFRDSIAPEKDVEGLCHTYRSNLYRNVRFMDHAKKNKCILPCTPIAVVKILEAEGVFDKSLAEGSRLQGKSITVVNRSEIVGRPLAALLANDGATVYSIDIDSTFKVTRGSRCVRCELSTEEACRLSQAVILGVPSKGFKLDAALCIKPGTLVVNVSSCKNVHAEELEKIQGVRYCSAVGKVTVAMLERNLLRLYENFHRDGRVTGADDNASFFEKAAEGGGLADLQSELNSNRKVLVWSAMVCVACTVVSSALAISMASKARQMK
mmetsp:Transcript_21127/g.41874  ORF Transcript_21127/g.41874 Transcript_21127/m.41874 type:complete len:373 (+) Transcript_21127:92-1210(+)|eukprot:CAMPEP_0171748826 /NCGR_PEP_ID=MMETSP0991-20121206/40360_1 /TAXON_ID=483369 /ORGANISM="non described non described, Strain CCMP2098" /LENGTH=372 /DNA_ID=CAMNT_0012349309 /DNA_START=6 /DNA_END=1124 /DNA_ORIENTATION=-